MILCFDVGNSQLCGGIFDQSQLVMQFRYDTKQIGSSDQFGVALRSIFSAHNINYQQITQIAISSVVPRVDYAIRAACIKYLGQQPVFLTSDEAVGISLQHLQDPKSLGSDLLAGCIGVSKLYPKTAALIFDLGTATTCCYLNHSHELLGVSIAPGVKLMMQALHLNTAKLTDVNIKIPTHAIGTNTKQAIQSGIYYATYGFIAQLTHQTMKEYNLTTKPLIIGTGGFSNLFVDSNPAVFDCIVPELLLIGLRHMLAVNNS